MRGRLSDLLSAVSRGTAEPILKKAVVLCSLRQFFVEVAVTGRMDGHGGDGEVDKARVYFGQCCTRDLGRMANRLNEAAPKIGTLYRRVT
jgi:hypothetical protein